MDTYIRFSFTCRYGYNTNLEKTQIICITFAKETVLETNIFHNEPSEARIKKSFVILTVKTQVGKGQIQTNCTKH
jgi:hypothetical protein